ncbi:hypothetical protein SY88_07215 [Clostridiales bacterium PH28_bin88]|nr:hypothetical protein SY88_07215 [Clostridiales bacterium PH28_bin88]
MRLRIAELRLGLEHTPEEVRREAARRLGISPEALRQVWVVRQAVDARRKQGIGFVYTVDVLVEDDTGRKALGLNIPSVGPVAEPKPRQLTRGQERLPYPPVVVGAGPAGLFAALSLARWGYRPLLLERGREIARRTRDVEAFWQGGDLDPSSNVQFGEGGAGTFSDGKLTTRIKDERVHEVLRYLVEAGAPEEVAYLHKPHIGTDRLREVVVRLRRRLLDLGGQVRFQARVSQLLLDHRRVVGVMVNDQTEILAGVVVLAIGHSARDTYAALAGQQVAMEPKPFAVGLRVEHPQALIDKAQYGRLAGHPRLGAADYHLTYHSEEYGRNAYTFCMCPGGYVVAAASEKGGVVTNGMSEFARDSGIANSAVVVSVGPGDFPDEGPLAGVEFQRRWERRAYQLGGGDYQAPAQRVGDFLAGRVSGDLPVTPVPTYRPGAVPADLRDCLPKEVGEVLSEALAAFDRKLKGFAGDNAVLTGVETRTSAPLRLVRDERCCSVNTRGLYPAGEGAGYAGGIVSAAVDGMRVAEAIIETYALPEIPFPGDIML